MAFPIQQNETNYLLAFDTVNRNYAADSNQQLNDPTRTINAFPASNDNVTNNVLIDFKSSPIRLPAVSISIGSLEIPLTQLTIERLWNQLFYSEFYEPLVPSAAARTSASADAMTSVTVQYSTETLGPQSFTASIPPLQNPIVEVTTVISSPTVLSITFRTQNPHGLAVSNFYNWSEVPGVSSIQLVGTGLPATYTTLNSTNASFKILDEFSFELENVIVANSATTNTTVTTASPVVSPLSAAPVFGYVSAPPIPGPAQLTSIVTAALQANDILAANHVSMTFMPKLHQTTFQFIPLVGPSLVTKLQGSKVSFASQNPNPNVFQSTRFQAQSKTRSFNSSFSTAIDVPSATSSSGGYVFGSTVNQRQIGASLKPILPINVNNQSTLNDNAITKLMLLVPAGVDSLALQLGFPETVSLIPTKPSQNSVSYFHFSMIKIDAGNYTFGSQLAPQLEFQWNRFYLERPYSTVPLTLYKFAFSDSTGTVFVIDVPFGMYTPQTLASFLQTQMNAVATLGTTYSVSYNNDSFTFTSQNPTTPAAAVFALEFSTAAGLTPQYPSPYTGSAYPALPTRLGFLPIAYRGLTTYSSPIQAYAPQASAFSSTYLVQQTSPNRDMQKTYVPETLVLPITSSPYNDPYPRSTSLIWQPVFSSNTNKFTFGISLPKPVTGTVTTTVDPSDATKRIVTVTFGDAHGFQTQQPISLTFTNPAITGSPRQFNVIVNSVVNAFAVTVDPGPIFALPIGSGGIPIASWNALAAEPVTAQLAYTPTANLFMAPFYSAANSAMYSNPDLAMNQLPAAILGFPEFDFIWSGTAVPDFATDTLVNGMQSSFPNASLPRTFDWTLNSFDFKSARSLFPLTSPNTIDLDGPPYLLVQVSEPNIYTHFQHRWKQDALVNLLAKIQLHAPGCHKIERFLHVQGQLGGAYGMLTALRITLLNPNHTPYQLHNKNWSGTISVVALQDRVQLIK